MKTRKIYFVFILAIILPGMGAAQDCSYYSISKGMVLGYQNMDAKGKVTGTSRSTCLDVERVGEATIYKMRSDYADAKNNKPSTYEYTMRCVDGKFYVDMQNFIDPNSMEGFKDMQITADSKDMEYPSELSTGQSLPMQVSRFRQLQEELTY